MRIIVKCGNNRKVFDGKSSVVISGNSNADFIIPQLGHEEFLKLVFAPKYNNYVLVNSANDRGIFCNDKNFSKVLVPSKFVVTCSKVALPIEFVIEESADSSFNNMQQPEYTHQTETDIEKQRVSIIKEIGYKVIDLKNYSRSASITGMFLNIAMAVLSLVSSFAVTNYLLGLTVDTSASVLNLSTNFWFLGGITIVVFAISLILRQSIASLMEFNARIHKRYGETPFIQRFIIIITSSCLFVVYVMNLLYYKNVQGSFASIFISLMFVGALATVAVGSGYYKHQLNTYQKELTDCEYREDFENVLKEYRKKITKEINELSDNKMENVHSNLVNLRMKMVIEGSVGVLTAPFLAYGVSNTLAGCFPEAANWVRISGLRFSPIFLVLATALIIFAFISFVRAFNIGRQLKGSEIIKLDGFHDYNSHGVTIFGLDAMRNLEKDRHLVLFIACFIIFIEFTMNVSYFVTEIGGDIRGMFLSFVTALVPTAILIAETHLLGGTMHKINNYEELISLRD